MNIAEKKLDIIVKEIRELDSRLARLVNDTSIRAKSMPSDQMGRLQCLRFEILSFSLIRIRHFILHTLVNNQHIETMQTVSIGRYIFELVIWLKLIETDIRFALLFNRKSIEDHIGYAEGHRALLKVEESFYNQQAEIESEKQRQAVTEFSKKYAPDEDIGLSIADRMETISQDLDKALDSKLLLRYEEIKEKGYGYVAASIKKQSLPEIDKKIFERKKDLEEFDSNWSSILEELNADWRPRLEKLPSRPKKVEKLKYKERAQLMEMEIDYDFFYSYSCKLLHASPSSILSNAQNLSLNEFLLFWRYIRNQFRSTVDLVSRVLNGDG